MAEVHPVFFEASLNLLLRYNLEFLLYFPANYVRLLINEISLSWPTTWPPTRGNLCKITSIENHKRTKVKFFDYRLEDVVRKKVVQDG